MKLLLRSLPALALLATGTGSAATVSVVGTPGASGSAALPSAPGTDWGYWATTTNPVVGGASNTSTAGNQSFTVTPVGGGNTRGSSSALASTLFTFSNGTSQASSPGLQVGGIFNTTGVGTSLNTGVGITLTDIAAPVRIQLYTYVFEGTGVMNAYLNGSTTSSYTNSIVDTNGGKSGYLYTFDYVPDNAASSVRFEWVKTTSDDPSSNVGFTAISISPIPEASSIALLGTAAVAGLLRRRRR